MSWFDTSSLTSLAKSALKEAQKTIDKALDIQDESSEEQDEDSPSDTEQNKSPGNSESPKKDSDFLASWGLTMSAEKEDPIKEQPVVTESPSKCNSQSIWGSFAGSFFDQGKTDDTIVSPPKAKSMNVIADAKYGSQDDLFSKSQLVMSDSEGLEFKSKKEDLTDERRGSSKSNRLSLVSSRNSSDSVEVLSHSLKTTPDSDASAQSISHSSSAEQKHNSESVEILPDSLVSPSSIECLGFDSCTSDSNGHSVSSNLSPNEESDKKSTPIGERTEKPDTADSVSLVADDDDDTMSYNSISECTAPTVLDTDNKSVSPFPRMKFDQKKIIEKELINLEQVIQKTIQMSETSSNDGSWSDRTLNADNDNVTLEAAEEQKRELDPEDVLIEKLSDSSSFYNVNVDTEIIRPENVFVNVEKQQCSASPSSGSSQKDGGSVKEGTSPISSDSKSDLVKIGSDRTSGHTSGDELETATSSDIEIIPSPNGDNGSFCRNSPGKYGFKLKFDGTTSPHLVDLVLGKSLATKIRGHNRELSEASIQSNTSDDSQGSENDRLMKRLCEMAEILEARENRLMEVSKSNAELAESNIDLKNQVESLRAKHDGGDISTITEEYTQRMSALEKKFQQAIREKDLLRKQLDTVKSECSTRKNSSEFENSLKEKDDVISQLQEEGEKLSRQQLQHSNIIKKLRAKEKDNEQVIKSLRDKIAELTGDLDRLKRSMAAKEELEVNQIEAVYRLTTANKKLETELVETKGALDDTTHRLESTRTSLEAARKELTDLQRNSGELQKLRGVQPKLEEEKKIAEQECAKVRAELQALHTDMCNEQKRWLDREEALRREIKELRESCAALEASGGGGHVEGVGEAAGVLAQLAQLQRAAMDREHAHTHALRQRALQIAELERSLAKAVERERVSREECQALLERLSAAEGLLRDSQTNLQSVTEQCQQYVDKAAHLETQLNSKTRELETARGEYERRISELESQLNEAEQQLAIDRNALDVERKRNAILQEQMCGRGDVSPPHSFASDSLSASLWHSEEGTATPTASTALCVEETLAQLTRREGELRMLVAHRDQLLTERNVLREHVAKLQATLDEQQSVQEQYDALLQMYGEKEEQLAELRLDLQDVTQLYKQHLDELAALKRAAGAR